MAIEKIISDFKNKQECYNKNLSKILNKKIKKSITKAHKNGILACQIIWEDKLNLLNEEIINFKNRKDKLIIDIAKKMIEDELINNKNTIVEMVINLLNNNIDHQDVEIIVNPIHEIVLNESINKISFCLSDKRKIYIKYDENLSLGCIIIKANKNIIDAKIDHQLEKAYSILKTIEG